MSISIITRAYKASELENLINNLNSHNEIEKEIVAVCNINDYNITNATLIIQNTNRFEARVTGIKNSNYDKVLFLDSDQIPEVGLLKELDGKKQDMVIIPEGSICSSFTSRCLNDWRNRNEKLAKRKTTPCIPVIPRFYKKKYLLAAVNKLSPNVYKIIDHEDSILYYYVFQETQDIEFSEKHIFNNDPSFFKLLHKAYLYGKNNRDTKKLVVPNDILLLIYNLNKTTFDIKELGLGKGYIIQIIRGFFYELGKIFSK